MDLSSNHTSPVLTDTAPVASSRLGIKSLVPYPPTGTPFSPALFLALPWKKTGILDDLRSSNPLLDAMKSSSPTYNRRNKDSNTDQASMENDVVYRNWMLRYPSALASFEQITNFAMGKRIALFLDYDGTLSPIVEDPDKAFMSNAMRAAVKNAAKYFPTAIISGRSRDKVYEFVGLTELYYAGSHGMDIMTPILSDSDGAKYTRAIDKQGKEVNVFQPAREFLPMIDEVYGLLVETTKDIVGAKVENNRFCVSVHYRNIDEQSWDTLGKSVENLLKRYPRLQMKHGRMVLEVRPVLDWDKGKAVEFLLESLGLKSCEDVLPIYVGDDRTDEDAFKVLREQNRGYGILVSSAAKESNAFYSLRDPSEVMEFLRCLVTWKRSTTQ